MGVEKQPNLDTWDDFAGDFIKADLVQKYPALFVVKDVKANLEDGRPKLLCQIEYNGREWIFDLNKTNQNFVRNSGVKSPKALIGKKLTMAVIKVRNPTTGNLVNSLVIDKIE